MRARFVIALALALIAAVPEKAGAAEVPAGAEWTYSGQVGPAGPVQDAS